MNNLLTSLRNAQPALSQKLEAGFIESPHEFELDIARVAMPLNLVSHMLEFVPDESLPPDICGAALKRRLNFIGGRFCAESALERIGFAGAVVQRDALGAPIWPDGTVGSITHTDQFAYAVVSRSVQTGNVGIDSEDIFSDSVLTDVRSMCCTGNENLNLFNSTNSNVVGTIIFSVKESLYKSIHPIVKRFVDFSEVEITGIDWYLSKISLRSVRECDLSSVISSCYAFFCISNESKHTTVHTSVYVKSIAI
jgi:enterobactin synthetase component D